MKDPDGIHFSNRILTGKHSLAIRSLIFDNSDAVTWYKKKKNQ